MTTINPQEGQTVRWGPIVVGEQLFELEHRYGKGPFIVTDYGRIPRGILREHLEHKRWMRLADSKSPQILVSRALLVFDDPKL